MLNLLVILSNIVLSAILYRLGGWSKGNRLFRIIGVPLVNTASLIYFIGWDWWLIVCFGLFCGAISAYWNKEGEDETFINYWLHGFGIALAILPWNIANDWHWIGFSLRIITMPLGVAWWATYMNKPIGKIPADWVNELGRGAIIGASNFLLLI